MPYAIALQLLKYAEADEVNAGHLAKVDPSSPIAASLISRATVMRAAAEKLVPGLKAPVVAPSPRPTGATPDDLVGEDLAASRAMIPR